MLKVDLRQVAESNDPISRMTDGDGVSPMQDNVQVGVLECVPNARQSTSVVLWSVMKNNEQVCHWVPRWGYDMQWSKILDFHGKKVSTGNVETNSTMGKFRNHGDSSGRGQWSNVTTRLGRQRTSGQNPASQRGQKLMRSNKEDESMGTEQFNYFEKVLENSITTSEERVEQLRELRCRTSWWMKTGTGSTAAEKGWTAALRTKGFQQVSRSKYVERNDHSKRDGEMFEEDNESRSMKVMGVNLKGQIRYITWCDKAISDEFRWQHRRNHVRWIRSVTSVQAEHWVN